MANTALPKEEKDAAIKAAREILKEDPEAALLRVRGHVAVFIGCDPEELGPVRRDIK